MRTCALVEITMTECDTLFSPYSWNPKAIQALVNRDLANIQTYMRVGLPTVALASAYVIWRSCMSEHATKQMRDWFADQARERNSQTAKVCSAIIAASPAARKGLVGLNQRNVSYKTAVRFIFNFCDDTDAQQIARYASLLRRLHAACRHRRLRSLCSVAKALLDLDPRETDESALSPQRRGHRNKESVRERRDKLDCERASVDELLRYSYPTAIHMNSQEPRRSARATRLGYFLLSSTP